MKTVIRGTGALALVVGLVIGVAACSQAALPTAMPASPTNTAIIASAPATPLPIHTSTPEPMPAPTAVPLLVPTRVADEVSWHPTWNFPPSLDEQIVTSQRIVRATLKSVVAGTRTRPSSPGVAPTYLAIHILTFQVHEYLKGSGPTELSVEVAGLARHLKQANALLQATTTLAERDTTWDKREAILFLSQTESAASAADLSVPSTAPYTFTTSNPYAESEWNYDIDSLNRAWMPAAQESVEGVGGLSNDQNIITNGSVTPPTQMTLASLRTRIAEINALFATGDNSEAYNNCVTKSLLRERYYRDFGSHTFTFRIDSGTASGIAIEQSSRTGDLYSHYYTSGKDAVLFNYKAVDNNSAPSDGYKVVFSTARPLPAGTYTVKPRHQHYSYAPCNYFPTEPDFTYSITVTAPTGTVHEAFFDPAIIEGAVGADASNGVLKPATFSLGDASSSIVGLGWGDGEVTLVLSPYVSLAGKRLDFIELDGSVSLALSFDDGSVDRTVGTVVWGMDEQPWESGDRLMIRIR